VADGTALPVRAAGEPRRPAAAEDARLLQDDRLRDRIIEHLRRVEHDSISGLARAVSAGREAPVHRLTVAGYLQALADFGVLRELERPPSKEYRLQTPEAHWSLHQRAWRLVRDLDRSEPDKARLLLAILQTLLQRPVFHAELEHAGLHPVPADLPRVVLPDEVRRNHRRLFERKASPRIDIPSRDPTYELPPTDPWLRQPAVAETLRRLVLKACGGEHLAAERPAAPAQRRLDGDP